jgi:radical SAM superfamily enzyme YgiQ (UPF0313 family)
MHIGLVHCSNKSYSDNQNYGLKFAPIWAFTLSSYIKKEGHQTSLFDLNVSKDFVIKRADAYFLSGINQDLEEILRVAKYIKTKFHGSPLFLGGPIAWSFDQASELDKLDLVDHICVGDGELLVKKIIDALTSSISLPKIVRADERFDFSKSVMMDPFLVYDSYKNYYGAVIEVSRGCPFLCEFCDIRTMPDNNRNHSRDIDVIISELELYRKLGIRNIQLACDNFIGDLPWAHKLVDAIITFNTQNKYSPSFYTWLTINIAGYDDLMEKMRYAGFDNLFIGVESFENNTLLETAKLQNTKLDIINSLRNIQSFGFIVVAGLIFGFDSDSEFSFESTLDGITESGLLSGDASLLTALPGTPLYRRMRLSKRLRIFKHDALLGGHKYVTNIMYLLPKELLINGYINFSKTFLEGKFQYRRISNFYSIIASSKNLVNITRPGYTDIGAFLQKTVKSPKLFYYHLIRLLPLFQPNRLFHLIMAIGLGIYMKIKYKIGFQYLIFWLFIWVNALSKYGKIHAEDFNIESVPVNFDYNNLIPDGYLEQATEKIPQNKINAQFKSTVRQLQNIIQIKKLNS